MFSNVLTVRQIVRPVGLHCSGGTVPISAGSCRDPRPECYDDETEQKTRKTNATREEPISLPWRMAAEYACRANEPQSRKHSFTQVSRGCQPCCRSPEPHSIGACGLHRNAKVDLLRRVPLFAGAQQARSRTPGRHRRRARPASRTDADQGGHARPRVLRARGGRGDRREGRPARDAPCSPATSSARSPLVTDVPRTSTVTAKTPVRLLVLTKRDFQRLLREQPEIQRKVLEALALRLAPETL